MNIGDFVVMNLRIAKIDVKMSCYTFTGRSTNGFWYIDTYNAKLITMAHLWTLYNEPLPNYCTDIYDKEIWLDPFGIVKEALTWAVANFYNDIKDL